ncbi:16S rRNA (adenine(1518)-N(6)/adenine(1519)-N(6))-dimethyltransferase RsmA [Candidatus Parcubacteria bacterium]|nr:16S rRNA (adenine(1518)-N(6)/adenine(1519)-N(6))-dimethyltransferase RsmA [Candidatus Parcubacteria bacterium]
MHHPKKSLGQNFLKSKEALRDIVTAGQIKTDDVILEIGPGKGALTEMLLTVAGKIMAIEKDAELVSLLQEKFKTEIGSGRLDIKQGDILEFDPTSLGTRPLPSKGESPLGGSTAKQEGGYKIIANIPYNITGAIIQKFLTAEYQPELMVLLLQKEVAQRIVARDKKESILSIGVKAYGTPKYIGTVKAKYFSPPPKVDSGILLVENISRDFFKDIDEKFFFDVMKAGFAHKRKMLIGNLKNVFENRNFEELFAQSGIDKKTRAEDITLEDWKKLSRVIRE